MLGIEGAAKSGPEGLRLKQDGAEKHRSFLFGTPANPNSGNSHVAAIFPVKAMMWVMLRREPRVQGKWSPGTRIAPARFHAYVMQAMVGKLLRLPTLECG